MIETTTLCTLTRAREILDARFGGLLRRGSHAPNRGECCVRELSAILFAGAEWIELEPSVDGYWTWPGCSHWTDDPEHSSTDAVCRRLNDAAWSNDNARTWGCLPLVCLREADAAPGWIKRYVVLTIRELLADLMARRGFAHLAKGCRAVQTLVDARWVAARCRRFAADAATTYAATAADYAADDAAYIAVATGASDAILIQSVAILLRAHRGGP